MAFSVLKNSAIRRLLDNSGKPIDELRIKTASFSQLHLIQFFKIVRCKTLSKDPNVVKGILSVVLVKLNVEHVVKVLIISLGNGTSHRY